MKVQSRYRAAQAARRAFTLIFLFALVWSGMTFLTKRSVTVPESAAAWVKETGFLASDKPLVLKGPAEANIRKVSDVQMFRVDVAVPFEITATVRQSRFLRTTNSYSFRITGAISIKSDSKPVDGLMEKIQASLKECLVDDGTKVFDLEDEERSALMARRVERALAALEVQVSGLEFSHYAKDPEAGNEVLAVTTKEPLKLEPQFGGPTMAAFLPQGWLGWTLVTLFALSIFGGGGGMPWFWIWLSLPLMVGSGFVHRRQVRGKAREADICGACFDGMHSWWFFNQLPDPPVDTGPSIDLPDVNVGDACGACDAPQGCDLPGSCDCGVADCGPADCAGCDPGGCDLDCSC